MVRRAAAEFIGTGVLVFIGVGVATLVFGFHVFGYRSADSVAAGVVAVGLAFGLVLMALVYVLGPVSSCHINPAVTLGALLTRQIKPAEAGLYWIAQFAGGILGALLLYGLFNSSPFYAKSRDGLGTNGWGADSLLHVSEGGAFLTEVVLTAIFVFVVLAVSRQVENKAVAGIPIGLALTAMHIFGVAIDGTSVNPARSLGPAVITGGLPLRQVWLFIVAPLVGAAVAAGVYWLLHRPEAPAEPEIRIPRLRSETITR
jgi:aquaporin Z